MRLNVNSYKWYLTYFPVKSLGETHVMNRSPIDFEEKKVSVFKNPPEGEQDLVRRFFGNKQHGYYVDVGANHPTEESQTWHLEQLGWKGWLIEPLSYYCELLKERRSGTVIQCACSSRENHDKVLRLISDGVHSTLNENPIAIGAHSEEYVDVTCKTLDSILESNSASPGFDFISIDIEGHEMEMFRGFSLQKWRPKLVLLEDHVINHEKHNHMTRNGYQLIMRTGINSWYVPRDFGYRLSAYALLQYFRKYWLGILWRKIKYAH